MSDQAIHESDTRAHPPTDFSAVQLERAAVVVFEAGNAVASSFLVFVGCVVGTTVLALSLRDKSAAQVTIFGLNLSQRYAAELLWLCSCGAFYKYLALLSSESFLQKKLQELMDSGGLSRSQWYLRFPSIAHFQGIMAPHISKNVRVFGRIFAALAIGLGFLVPLALGYAIGSILVWPWDMIVTAVLGALFLMASLVLYREMDKADFSRILRDLDSVPSKEVHASEENGK